jgi:hypothetical protein
VLSWPSPPRQGLHHPQIQPFIQHDALTYTIALFPRTEPRCPDTYLGRLKYLAHDGEREHPGYFQWPLLGQPPPREVMQRTDLKLRIPAPRTANGPEPEATTSDVSARLKIAAFQPSHLRAGLETSTRTFRAHQTADYAERDAKHRTLGHAGECLVVAYARHMLIQQGRPDLAQRVRHVAQMEGDGAGYDVLSFTEDGTVKYIEVKTTRGSAETAFFMSAHELAFARQHAEHDCLYRIYRYQTQTQTGTCYIITGNPEALFDMTPTQYRLRPL